MKINTQEVTKMLENKLIILIEELICIMAFLCFWREIN